MSKINKAFWSGARMLDYQKRFNGNAKDFYYGPACPPESKLRILGDVKGKRVLDLGCGTGHNAVYLAKKGAHVTAIDFSSEMVRFAEHIAFKNKVKVDFIKGDITDVDKLVRKKFDLIVSTFTFQYVEELPRLFKKAKALLAEGGTFIFSIDHPFFRTISYKTFKVQERYWKTGRQVERSGKASYVVYSHTLSDLTANLKAAGFSYELMEPARQRGKDPWRQLWGDLELIRYIPHVLVFIAE